MPAPTVIQSDLAGATGVSTLSVLLTVAAGESLVAFVASWDGTPADRAVSSITWQGQALTPVVALAQDPASVAAYVLAAPTPAVNQPLQVTWAGAVNEGYIGGAVVGGQDAAALVGASAALFVASSTAPRLTLAPADPTYLALVFALVQSTSPHTPDYTELDEVGAGSSRASLQRVAGDIPGTFKAGVMVAAAGQAWVAGLTIDPAVRVFADELRTDAPLFLETDEFGESATYTRDGAPPFGALKDGVLPCLVDPTFDLATGSLVDTRQAVVVLADPIFGVAVPQAGDRLTLRGRTCRVEGHTINPDGLQELEIEVGGPAP